MSQLSSPVRAGGLDKCPAGRALSKGPCGEPRAEQLADVSWKDRFAMTDAAWLSAAVTGPAILDTLSATSRLARWPQLHIARAALLAQCGRREDAAAAYRDALALEPAEPVCRHITSQIAALGAAHAPTEET
jgi:hypothetical protein